MKQKTMYKQSTIKNVKFIDSDSLYKRFVNPESVLVKIHDNIDFSFVNGLCEDVYSQDGQHAYLPELCFRVNFIQLFKGGLSDNEVVKQCETNMEYRYFCNLAIDDDLFDDCKLSRFREELGVERFKQIFDVVVQSIKNAGFISEHDVQYMDSFLFLADVKVISINALLSKTIKQCLSDLGKTDREIEDDSMKKDFDLSEDEQKKRFVFLVHKAQDTLIYAKKLQLTSEAKRSLGLLRRIVKERSEIVEDRVRKKESGEEKDKIINLSDTDARMMGKGKKEIVPSYKSHIAMNANGFITFADATLATVYDGHFAYNAIGDLKQRGFTVPQAVGDTHYGDIRLREDMAMQQTQMIAPYRKNQVLNSCLTQDVMIEAWAFNHTPEYAEQRRIRSHIEPKQGEMKNLHGMRRARLRGLDNVRMQALMSGIVTNCKRWVRLS